jgi:hypothetical protein
MRFDDGPIVKSADELRQVSIYVTLINTDGYGSAACRQPERRQKILKVTLISRGSRFEKLWQATAFEWLIYNTAPLPAQRPSNVTNAIAAMGAENLPAIRCSKWRRKCVLWRSFCREFRSAKNPPKSANPLYKWVCLIGRAVLTPAKTGIDILYQYFVRKLQGSKFDADSPAT